MIERKDTTMLLNKKLKLKSQRNTCGHGRHCSCNPSVGLLRVLNKSNKLAMKAEAFKVERIAY